MNPVCITFLLEVDNFAKYVKLGVFIELLFFFFFLEIRTVVLCKVRKTNCNLLQSIHRWFNNGIIDHG